MDSNTTMSPVTFHVGPTGITGTTEAPPAPPRSCGPCTLCCKVMAIKDPELEKPKDVWCQHAKKGCGCGIYDTRPSICRGFECMWLGGEFGRYAEFRPDKIHGLLTPTTDGKNFVVHEDPGYERHAREALKDFIDRWLAVEPEHYVIVVCGIKRAFLGNRDKYQRLLAAGVEEVVPK